MTRILVVSDIHGSSVGALAIKRMVAANIPDFVVVCGDITHFGRKEWDGGLLDFIDAPVMAVDGNCDIGYVAEYLVSDRQRGLMNRLRQFDGMDIFGLSYPPDPDTVPERFDMLVSHVPPRGCNDSVRAGHIGDDGLRALVLERKPMLALSGHVHEARGTCKLGNTVCVNPGPARDGLGALVIMGDGIQVEMLNSEIPAKL